MKKINSVVIIVLTASFFLFSCKKYEVGSNAYIPSETDVTATATLVDLQKGRELYIQNCVQCHNLPSPDDYSPMNWNSVLTKMVPKTNLTDAQTLLVKKYVTHGKL